MEKNLEKPYLTKFNLLIVKDLWQAYYKILLIILMKEFIKQNINMNIIIKIAKREELNTKIMGAIFKTQELKMI